MTKTELVHALVRLYPRTWRARYETELLALIDEDGASARTILDLLLGAARERAHQVVDASGTAVVGRSVFTPRVFGVRIVVVLVGNVLSAIFGGALSVRASPRDYLELQAVYLIGSMVLLIRTGWLGWAAHRDRRQPTSSRAFARFEAVGWMGLAIALGALSNRAVHFNLYVAQAFATSSIWSAIFTGNGGVMLMLAFDAFVKQTASHHRWLTAEAIKADRIGFGGQP